MDALTIANSAVMWFACAIPVALVVVQACVFAKNAYSSGEKVGLTKSQMRGAMRSAAITSIGPSVVVLSGMLALLITVGAPVGWMRLSLIGSVMFESIAAGIGTNTVGVTLGTDPMTAEALCMAVWTMVLCSIGWVIFASFSADRMDKIQQKISGGDIAKLVSISTGAVIGVFCATSSQHLVRMNKNSVACVLGGVFMLIMTKVSANRPRLREWNLTISILAAMIITALI